MLRCLAWPGQTGSAETQCTAVCHKGVPGSLFNTITMYSHSCGLRDIIFPEGHNTKPPMFLNEVKLTARHTCQRLVFCCSLCQKGLLGSAKLREFPLDKKIGASELQQGAPEASKPTLLGSPEVGLNMDSKTCLVSCQYCRVERRCSTSNSRFF